MVLVDRGSASASEIVTGALRDSHRGAITGERTFGKGVFQELEPLSNGGALDLTVESAHRRTSLALTRPMAYHPEVQHEVAEMQLTLEAI